jgi:hypothetical protein
MKQNGVSQSRRAPRTDAARRAEKQAARAFHGQHREIQVQTAGHKEMHDLTDEVARIVNESGARSGIVHVFNVGSTAAIGTIEP